ncbi:MAG: SH3 domain-containing protein, partial [Anaerolineae bacterium]|nr:SH3 domain-containing protein [Anaerolineae bacterium]
LIFNEISDGQVFSTRTPAPTFTVTLTPPPAIALITPSPSPTSSPTPSPSPTHPPPTATATPTETPTPLTPQVIAARTVNVRSGPGTNYPVVGSLPPNVPVMVSGRNGESSWWQIQAPDGRTGWVAGLVVETRNVGGVAVAQAPPPPVPPTATPVPEPTRPRYQYEPTGWYGDTNYGLTRFLGTITDINGNPVDGVRIEAQCGSFRIISNPSGPVGAGYFNESHTWPPGFYDITLDRRPIPCKWFLTVVETPDGETVTARLSEAVEVETTIEESIVTANWRKNW